MPNSSSASLRAQKSISARDTPDKANTRVSGAPSKANARSKVTTMKSREARIQLPRWTVRIPDWKELHIERLHVQPTYLGVLEGSVKCINESIIEGLPERAGATFCAQRKKGVIPVHLFQPSPKQMLAPLPTYLCMALATAAPVRNKTLDDDTLYSRVVCCWFTVDPNRRIEQLLRDGIRPFSWDDYAQNR